jgi:hypothetical protein
MEPAPKAPNDIVSQERRRLGADQLVVLSVVVFALVVIGGFYVPAGIAKAHALPANHLANSSHVRKHLTQGMIMICVATVSAPIVLYQFTQGYYENPRTGKRITRTGHPLEFLATTTLALASFPLLFCLGLWLILFG